MDSNDQQSEKANGAEQPTRDVPPFPRAEPPAPQEGEPTGHNGSDRRRIPTGEHDQQPPPHWTHYALGVSAIVQAICAALILIATVAILCTTEAYTTYTHQQASAEATSANAAIITAHAEATAAAQEKVSADAARSAANTAAAALSSSSAQFAKQLAKLDASIGAARDLASATRTNVRTAVAALGVNETQFRVAQRPWLWPDLEQPLAYDAQSHVLKAVATVKNSGLSPAVKTVIRAEFVFGIRGWQLIDDFFSHATLASMTSGSHQTSVYPPGGSELELVRGSVPQQEANWAMTTDQSVFVVMRIWYSDHFGKWHHSDFCKMWYASVNAWPDCLNHNEAD